MLLLATYGLVVSKLGEARWCLAGTAEVVVVVRRLPVRYPIEHPGTGTPLLARDWLTHTHWGGADGYWATAKGH